MGAESWQILIFLLNIWNPAGNIWNLLEIPRYSWNLWESRRFLESCKYSQDPRSTSRILAVSPGFHGYSRNTWSFQESLGDSRNSAGILDSWIYSWNLQHYSGIPKSC